MNNPFYPQQDFSDDILNQFDESKIERMAIMTVDGGITFKQLDISDGINGDRQSKSTGRSAIVRCRS